MLRSFAARLWQPALVGLAAIAPIAPALLPDRTLSWRDTAALTAPVRTLVVEALRNLRLPLWNPLEGTGQPLFAQMFHAVLHPISLLCAALRADTDLLLILYVAFAAAGCFVAARRLGCSTAAAAGAGFAFGLSGYVLGMTCNAGFLAGTATLPWVVAGSLVAAEGDRRGVAACAAGVACGVFAGDPQALAAGMGVGLVLAWRRRPSPLARVAAGQALGLLLGAVQLLPTLAHLSISNRTTEAFRATLAQSWPLDPARLVELVSPGFFNGEITQWQQPVYLALGSPSPYPLPWAPSVFVGAVVLLLAASAWPDARAKPILLLALLFGWLAMGHHLGAAQLTRHLPVWGKFLFAEKLVGPLTLCLALGAGLGIDASPRGNTLPRITLAALACFATALVALPFSGPLFGQVAAPAGMAVDVGAVVRSRLLVGLGHAAAATFALAALLLWRHRWERVLRWSLAAVVFAQGAAASSAALHWGRAEPATACPPALQGDPPGARLQTAFVRNVSGPIGGLDPIDALQRKLARLGVSSTNVACGVDALEPYTGFATRRAQIALGDLGRRLRLGSRYGVTHVISEPPTGPGEANALFTALRGGQVVEVTRDFGLWTVPHRPWASFAASTVVADSPASAVDRLEQLVAAGRDDVVVETAGGLPAAPGRVLEVRRGREELSVVAEAGADGLLVVNEAYHPGWIATLDGAPAELLPADGLVRAVRWPAGRHVLQMRFAPREVAWGGWLSLLAALACGGLAFPGRPASPRPSVPEAPPGA